MSSGQPNRRRWPTGAGSRGLSQVFSERDFAQSHEQQEARPYPSRTPLPRSRLMADAMSASQSISSHMASLRRPTITPGSADLRFHRDDMRRPTGSAPRGDGISAASSRRTPLAGLGVFTPGGRFREPVNTGRVDEAEPSGQQSKANAALEVIGYLRDHGFRDDPKTSHVKLPVRPRLDIPSAADMKQMFDWLYYQLDPDFPKLGAKRDVECVVMLSNLEYPHIHDVRRALTSVVPTPSDWTNVLSALLYMKRLLDWEETIEDRAMSNLTEEQCLDRIVEDYILELYHARLQGGDSDLQRYEKELGHDLVRYAAETEKSASAAEEEVVFWEQKLAELDQEEALRTTIDQQALDIKHDLDELERHLAKMPGKLEKLKEDQARLNVELNELTAEDSALTTKRSEFEKAAKLQNIGLEELKDFAQTREELLQDLTRVKELNQKRLAEVERIEVEASAKFHALEVEIEKYNSAAIEFTLDIRLATSVAKGLGAVAEEQLVGKTINDILSSIRNTKYKLEEKSRDLDLEVNECVLEQKDVAEGLSIATAKLGRLDLDLRTLQTQYEHAKLDFNRLRKELELQKETLLEYNSSLMHERTRENAKVRDAHTQAEKDREALESKIKECVVPYAERIKCKYNLFCKAYDSFGVNLKSTVTATVNVMEVLGTLSNDVKKVNPPPSALDEPADVETLARTWFNELYEAYTQELTARCALEVKLNDL